MPLYLRKSALRSEGEWFLAVRAKASSWMVTLGVMVVCKGCYVTFFAWAVAFIQGEGEVSLQSMMFQSIIDSLKAQEGNISRAFLHFLGMPSTPVYRTIIPPTIAQVVSRSPKPLTVSQRASS